MASRAHRGPQDNASRRRRPSHRKLRAARRQLPDSRTHDVPRRRHCQFDGPAAVGLLQHDAPGTRDRVHTRYHAPARSSRRMGMDPIPPSPAPIGRSPGSTKNPGNPAENRLSPILDGRPPLVRMPGDRATRVHEATDLRAFEDPAIEVSKRAATRVPRDRATQVPGNMDTRVFEDRTTEVSGRTATRARGSSDPGIEAPRSPRAEGPGHAGTQVRGFPAPILDGGRTMRRDRPCARSPA